MTVLYHNRNRRPDVEARLGVRVRRRRTNCSPTADYVVLTVPLTPETRGLIGRAELARMKPTAALVNVARGAGGGHGGADRGADATARSGWPRVDVTDPEPLPRDHPLLKLDNVDHHAAPGQCDGADAAADGGDVGREPAGGAGGEGTWHRVG